MTLFTKTKKAHAELDAAFSAAVSALDTLGDDITDAQAAFKVYLFTEKLSEKPFPFSTCQSVDWLTPHHPSQRSATRTSALPAKKGQCGRPGDLCLSLSVFFFQGHCGSRGSVAEGRDCAEKCR